MSELNTYLLDYSITILVVLLFYALLSNEIQHLKKSIEELNKTLLRLLEEIRRGTCYGGTT